VTVIAFQVGENAYSNSNHIMVRAKHLELCSIEWGNFFDQLEGPSVERDLYCLHFRAFRLPHSLPFRHTARQTSFTILLISQRQWSYQGESRR
jgi:hypothetical protein